MNGKVSESIRAALEQLHGERARIDAAIAKLEAFLNNLQSTDPNVWTRVVGDAMPTGGRTMRRKRNTAGWTDEKRSEAADRMRRYWAQRRLQNGAVAKSSSPKPLRAAGKKRSTAGWTDEKRSAAAERMRQYWEGRKAGENRDTASA